jgi:hypothetical protein
MTTKKAKTTFDCVAMKREIQAKIQAEIAGMSWEEEKAYYHRSAEKARLAGVWPSIGEKKKGASAPSTLKKSNPPRAHGAQRRKRSR